MKKFDIEKFDKFKINGVANFTLSDGTKIMMSDDGYDYLEIISKPNSTFSTRYTYYKDSYVLRSEGTFFYKIAIDEYKEYNEQGQVIKKKNDDEMFQFSIKDLIKKALDEFKIDLSIQDKNIIEVGRYVDSATKLPEYTIRVRIDSGSFRYIIIDGNSGNVKKDFVGHYIE